jgi:DNA-binding NtrC family response regulator
MKDIKLLIVDDEEAFVAAMEKRLTLKGITVSVAHNGLDGLRKLEEHPDIDVVLLDIKMPGIDGIETLRRIKASHPITEVIVLTGHATVETAIDGMRLGAFDYLMKPCELEALLLKVDEARNRKRQQQRRIIAAIGKELRGRAAR